MNGSYIEEKKKQNIIFFKTPNESTGYSEDEYTKTFGSTGAYQPIFVSILRTKVSDEEVDELGRLIREGARSLMLDGVVITSARSVDSLQLAIKKLNQKTSANQQQESVGSDWNSIPFFVVGSSTRNALAKLNNFNNPTIFPNPLNHEIQILGHNESGSGHKLAEFIKAYFSTLQEKKRCQISLLNNNRNYQDTNVEDGRVCWSKTSTTTIRLLYLIGSHQDSSLSENLSKHNDENEREEIDGNGDHQGRIRFELVPTRVYSIEPETQPRFEPHEFFLDHHHHRSTGWEHNDGGGREEEGRSEEGEDERRRMEEEIKEELEQLTLGENRAKKKTDWLVFFSPNSSRIVLENINNLLVQIKLKFMSLQRNLAASGSQEIPPCLHNALLHLNSMKIAAIGSTTATFLANHFAFEPQVVPLKPNPSSLLHAILDFDNRLLSSSSDSQD